MLASWREQYRSHMKDYLEHHTSIGFWRFQAEEPCNIMDKISVATDAGLKWMPLPEMPE